MALHGFPRAARGDAHHLVVVTGRTAGGESVAEPESVLRRNAVRGVGEGRGALVGGDDEIGIVIIPSEDVLWGDGLAALKIVGDVEKAADELHIGAAAFLEDRVAVAGRQLLWIKAAL